WAGFHVLGDHFYEPIPNLRELASSYDESPREILGHPIRLEDFEAEHVERVERYGTEFAPAVREQNYDFANFYFGPTDALSYYALLRERKPSAVIEIGQGMSTRVAVAALQKNAQETGSVPTMLSIDPYSRLLGAELKPQAIHFNVTAQRIQDVPTALLFEL